MKKHAYLIIVHNNFYVLDKLLRLIDDKRNDIYIHIDKKVKNFNQDEYARKCRFSNVIYTKKRYNVRWGGNTLVKAEMALFQQAFDGEYDYYHLLSGADMPIKDQDHIHEFFDNNHYEYINIDYSSKNHESRISKIHLDYTKWINRVAEPYLGFLQNRLKTNRLKKYGFIVYKGSEWVSLTHECVGMLLSKKKMIFKMVRFSWCADEVYKQTVIMDSPFSKNIYPYNDIRLIDWERNEGASPHTFVESDYTMLCNSNCLFARKFVAEKDKKIIDMVFDMVNNTEKETERD